MDITPTAFKKPSFPDEDCIENIITTPQAPTAFDLLPPEERLEYQEIIAFQQRLEQEQAALAKVKQIIEARINYNQRWIDGIESGALTVNDFISTYIRHDFFNRFSKEEKQRHKEQLSLLMLSDFEGEIKYYNKILRIFDSGSKYIIELIYTSLHKHESALQNERRGGVENIDASEIRYFRKILEILDPFITEEFLCFNRSINNDTVERIHTTTLKAILHSNAIRKLNPDLIMKCHSKIRSFDSSKIRSEKLGAVLSEARIVADKILNFTIGRVQQEEREFILLSEQSTQTETHDPIDIGETPLYALIRENFSALYNILKQLEKLEVWLANIRTNEKQDRATRIAEAKAKRLLKNTSAATNVNVAEQIPDLPDFCQEEEQQAEEEQKEARAATTSSAEQQNSAELEQFYAYKAAQLNQWRKRIEEHRTQKEEEAKTLRHMFIAHQQEKNPTINEYMARQLLALHAKLNPDSRDLFESLFTSSKAAKPHNFRFEQIQQLIKDCGGSIKLIHGSHFAIELPNTYHVSNPNLCDTAFYYLDFKVAVTGGSYKPHAGGDEWNRDAHKLCRQAFENAGITLERMRMAQEVVRQTSVMAAAARPITGASPAAAASAPSSAERSASPVDVVEEDMQEGSVYSAELARLGRKL